MSEIEDRGLAEWLLYEELSERDYSDLEMKLEMGVWSLMPSRTSRVWYVEDGDTSYYEIDLGAQTVHHL